MNKPVSFPLAKVLKDKGFDEPCISFYDLVSNQQINNAPLGNYNLTKQSVSIPIISDVVMWLYETHKIWIGVYEYRDHAADSSDPFVFRSSVTGLKEFKTPTEAYSAAIEFVLNNRLTSQTK